MASRTMPGTVLHIKPSADFAREATERLASQLSTVIQRFVNDVTSLDAALHEQEWRAIFCEQDEANNTHYSFMDSLPGMACQIRLDKQGALHFPYVSEGCFDLLGLTPLELQHHPQLLKPHPDDAESFRQSMLISASGTTPGTGKGASFYPPAGTPAPLTSILMEQLANRLEHQKTTPKSLVISRLRARRQTNRYAKFRLTK